MPTWQIAANPMIARAPHVAGLSKGRQGPTLEVEESMEGGRVSKDRSISTLAPECDVHLQESGHAPHCAAIALVSSSTMGKVAADAEWQPARHAHPLERCISSSALWRPKLLPSLLLEFHVGIAEWKAQFGIHLHVPPSSGQP